MRVPNFLPLFPLSSMRFFFLLLVLALSSQAVSAQDATPGQAPSRELTASEKRAADLEAKLRQTLEGSEEGGRVLLELVDLYYKDGQVFGLVRAGKTFVNAQAGHPKHEEVMGKLIEGLAIANRNAELKATILQFVDRYPKSKQAGEFHRMLAQVLEREGQRRDAADHYRASWEKRGKEGLDDAVRAFRLYQDLRSASAATAMGEMALVLLDQLPANTTAGMFGILAVHQTRAYGQQYAFSNEIGRKVLEKKVPLDSEAQWELPHAMGDSYRSEKQYANAIEAYRSSIARGAKSSEVYRNLIRSIYDAQGSHSDLKKAVDLYLKDFPRESVSRRMEMKYLLAADLQRSEKLSESLAALQEVFRESAYNAGRLFEWTGEEQYWPRVESVYRATIGSDSIDEYRLHYGMAMTHFRDRMKNPEKAQEILRSEILYANPLPGATSEFSSALGWILGNSASDREFQQEVDRYLKHARAHAHNQNYTGALGSWLEKARKSDVEVVRKNYKWAKDKYDAFRKEETTRLWSSALQNRMRGHGAREQLLQRKLSQEQEIYLLRLHTTDLKSYGDRSKKAEALSSFAKLARLLPKDYQVARDWVELGASYGEAEESRRALDHLLTFTQAEPDPGAWYHAVNLARRIESADDLKKAVAWIRKNQSQYPIKNHYLGTILDHFRHFEMEAELVQYCEESAKRDPGFSETARAVLTLVDRMENPEDRIQFLKSYVERENDNYAVYASRLANEYLKVDDFANFESLAKNAVEVRAARRLRPWSFGYVRDWVSHASGHEEWTAEQKRIVYERAEAMNYGRDSAVATLALLSVEGFESTPIERLLAYRETTLRSSDDSTSYSYLFSWAQRAMGREEYAEAASLGTGLIANMRSAAVDTQEKARRLVRSAYGKMGALGMEVSADNPIAPVLEIGLHLRLGDHERALATYIEQKDRFDEYLLELPTELVAFAADSHIAAGGTENQERAEAMLRKWLVAHSESERFQDHEKARIQLLLAKNYDRAKRYEVARSEYTTVVNRYPDTEEALEAKFGIGETQMAQKIFDQAEETFEELANSSVAKIRVRGNFLRGVLESRKGNPEEARDIFKEVLTSMPDVSLANETLYNLAEVYGGEQRYLDQLELLRTVGRLGQESKRWHEPGRALSIVVQDSDLGISRGHSRIPVEVITVPGGDRETAMITSGGAGKGLFIGEVETSLGDPEPGNGVLEVSGSDLIQVDYPEDFKEEFQFEPLATGDIGLAVDGKFEMASSLIEEEEEETERERMEREARENEVEELRRSVQRPSSEIKPGNPIYLRVVDLDRDLSNEADQVQVKVTSSSGDEVPVMLEETGSHSAVFEGMIATSDLPAGALATDTAIEQSPLMAIDKDDSTAWISQPDGLAPKWLSVDLKDLRVVTRGTVTTPDPANQAPVRARLVGSHDGRFWYPLAEHPRREDLTLPQGEFREMTRRVWKTNISNLHEWERVVRLSKEDPHSTEVVSDLRYATELPIDPEEARERKADPSAVLWQGTLIQPRAGAVRFALKGDTVALIVNGFPLQRPAKVKNSLEVDAYLEAGLHQIVAFATTPDSARRPAEILRARENPNSDSVRLSSFVGSDFDLEQAFVTDLEMAGAYPLGTMGVDEEGKWEFTMEERELRHVRFVVDEFLGQAVAINSVTIEGPSSRYIPTEADLLQLSNNNVLEIAPGDRIESVYIDELPTGGEPKNRALTQSLTATYYNGTIQPIAYDFIRRSDGTVNEVEKDLLRIDPGERITVEIVDFDYDSTGQRDQVPLEVQVGDGELLTLIATETQSNSGVFKAEIDTFDSEAGDNGAGPEDASGAPRIGLSPGDQVYFSYRDQENTFPGHAIDRECVVYVREPTDAELRILSSIVIPKADGEGPGEVRFLPDSNGEEETQVAFEVPLTVEVIDEDAARDSLSEVIVALTLVDEEGVASEVPVEVACRISSSFSNLEDQYADVRNPALHRGRFVGQITLRLGGEDSPSVIPREPGSQSGLVGRILKPVEEGAEPEGRRDSVDDGLVGVFNLTGNKTIRATYTDAENTTPEWNVLEGRAGIRSNAELVATDNSYLDPVESLQVGERLFLRLTDPDQDVSEERDRITVAVNSEKGEREEVALEETLSHSGVFTGSFKLKATPEPVPGNFDPAVSELEVFFGHPIEIQYEDPRPSSQGEPVLHTVAIPVSDGTDGDVSGFTKIFGEEALAIQTQFHIAESYFELFKSHLALDRKEEAEEDLRNGRRVLRELQEDYQDPKYNARIAYLLGQFAQELEDWDEAIDSYETIVKQYPDHSLAADAQYKLGQCYEEAERLDEALEAYVTLAATYPESPLISNVMIRINEHFYNREDYLVSAQVGQKFLERFENHEWAPRMAFRVGQCFYKSEEYQMAGEAFDDFVKRFPEDDLTAQSLFWAGESFRQGGANEIAFQRYNRCRWDFPESDAAKYSRGRLALPEMLQQFEREAQAVESEAE